MEQRAKTHRLNSHGLPGSVFRSPQIGLHAPVSHSRLSGTSFRARLCCAVLCLIAPLCLIVLLCRTAGAAKPESTGELNLPTLTLGGKQFWTDELLFREWRIQRNVLTGSYRLLDGEDVRRSWGTFDQCRAKLDEIKRARACEPMRGQVVIVLHGLGRSRSSIEPMAKYLAEEGHLTVLQFGYASTRASVAAHAKSLARVVENLKNVDEIDFVAHSLGNLVIRHYLADEIERTEGHLPIRASSGS